ncbi:MAG: hypothetical protein WAU28_03810 [Candidatus Moraniibacteriota bacterium]
MDKIFGFVRREWFTIFLGFAVIFVACWEDGEDEVTLYAKRGVTVAIVSYGNSSNQQIALPSALENDHWIRNARGRDACYQLVIAYDRRNGMYSVLGGPEKKVLLLYTRDPEDVLEWLEVLADFKCNTVSM